MARNIIFDLDGTVIDTSHRYRNKADGHIDLEFWFANSTPEMIALDALLPLADIWRGYRAAGHTIIVCTARDFSDNPKVPTRNIGTVYEKYLADNGLEYDYLLHRTMTGDDHLTLGDGELKTRLLTDLACEMGYTCIADMNAIMFDDNVKVIAEMCRQRIACYDAISFNRQLARGRSMPANLSKRLGVG